ncbi:MAG: ParA family protein [Burkholderiales bacterium]|nr:ParA family protein [Burkholderiales bacterium]
MNTIIVIAHQKGGVGKSTIAANIAVELSKLYEVNVIDLDFQKSLTYFNHRRINEKLKALNIVNINSPEDLKNILNNGIGVYIIDTGGFDADMNRLAIAGADLLITPVSDAEIEQVGLLSFRKILRDIREYRKDLQANILLNRIHPLANASLSDLYEFINSNPEFNIYPSILRDRADYKKSFSAGKSVVEYNNNAVEEMQLLINELNKFLKGRENG